MIVLILHLLYNWSLGWKGWVQSDPRSSGKQLLNGSVMRVLCCISGVCYSNVLSLLCYSSLCH